MSIQGKGMFCIGPWGSVIREDRPWLGQKINNAFEQCVEGADAYPLFLDARQSHQLRRQWEIANGEESICISEKLHLAIARFCAQAESFSLASEQGRLDWHFKNKLALPFGEKPEFDEDWVSFIDVPSAVQHAYKTVSQMVYTSNWTERNKEPLRLVPLFEGKSISSALNRISELACLCRKDAGMHLERIPYWIGLQFKTLAQLKQVQLELFSPSEKSKKLAELANQYDEIVNQILALLFQEQSDELNAFEGEESPSLARVKFHSFLDSHLAEFSKDFNEFSMLLKKTGELLKKTALSAEKQGSGLRLGVGVFNLLAEIETAEKEGMDLTQAYQLLKLNPAFIVVEVGVNDAGKPLVLKDKGNLELMLGEIDLEQTNDFSTLLQDINEVSGDMPLKKATRILIEQSMAVEVLSQLAAINTSPF